MCGLTLPGLKSVVLERGRYREAERLARLPQLKQRPDCLDSIQICEIAGRAHFFWEAGRAWEHVARNLRRAPRARVQPHWVISPIHSERRVDDR